MGEVKVTTVKMTTNLAGLKRNYWRRNLSGFFSVNGKPLSDSQIRKLVNWGIEHGCRTEADIPEDKIASILGETEKDKGKQLELFD